MLQHLLGVPFTLASFVVALSIVVFVHEFGHFLIARRCGVRCESFSIGFGPELFGRTDRYGTRWKFSIIPLGGYVKMYGESEAMQVIEGGVEHAPKSVAGMARGALAIAGGSSTEAAQVVEGAAQASQTPRPMTEEEKSVSLKYKTIGQRAAIVFAGPAVNFLFAIAVFFVIFLVYGRPVVEPVIGSVVANSPAEKAGFMQGDRIVAIDGHDIKRFEDIQRLVQLGYGVPMAVSVKRAGDIVNLTVTPHIIEQKDVFGNAQKTPILGIAAPIEPFVGGVAEKSPAAEAGLKEGDRFVSIDGHDINDFEDIQRLVQQGAGAPMAVSVKRKDDIVSLIITPRAIEQKDASGNVQKSWMLGIVQPTEMSKVERLGPVEALSVAVSQTYGVVEQTGVAVGQMIAGRRGTEDLGGVIRIAKYSGQAAKSGLSGFVLFVAILSINLGLINLFPVPLLDGGHLLFYAIEAVRGRPLSERAQEWGMRIGLALVAALMVFVTWNDIAQL